MHTGPVLSQSLLQLVREQLLNKRTPLRQGLTTKQEAPLPNFWSSQLPPGPSGWFLHSVLLLCLDLQYIRSDHSRIHFTERNSDISDNFCINMGRGGSTSHTVFVMASASFKAFILLLNYNASSYLGFHQRHLLLSLLEPMHIRGAGRVIHFLQG